VTIKQTTTFPRSKSFWARRCTRSGTYRRQEVERLGNGYREEKEGEKDEVGAGRDELPKELRDEEEELQQQYQQQGHKDAEVSNGIGDFGNDYSPDTSDEDDAGPRPAKWQRLFPVNHEMDQTFTREQGLKPSSRRPSSQSSPATQDEVSARDRHGRSLSATDEGRLHSLYTSRSRFSAVADPMPAAGRQGNHR
jgi:hypothetical protein